jgi:hypothetical protein
MPEKVPPVYLDYDQAALDAAYNQAAYAPNREQLIKRRISDSELARLRGSRYVLGSNFPVRCAMIARAMATISASSSPSAVANCDARTSSSARNVISAIPVPRGSTITIRSRRRSVRRPSPTTPASGHRRTDHPQRCDCDPAIGIEVIRTVEIDGIDVAARHELLQIAISARRPCATTSRQRFREAG